MTRSEPEFEPEAAKVNRQDNGDGEVEVDLGVVADLLLKIEEAEKDSDEMVLDRCVEDVQETIISKCKHSMDALAATAQRSKSTQISLKDFLYPPTFYLQLQSDKGVLQASQIDDASKFAGTHKPVRFALEDLEPRSGQSADLTLTLNTSIDIAFIEDLAMRKVLKVSHQGEVYIFKSAKPGNRGQFTREAKVLKRISEKWDPTGQGHTHRPRVPRFIGLVTDGSQVICLLEEVVDGTNLHDFKLEDTSLSNWKSGSVKLSRLSIGCTKMVSSGET